MLRSVYIVTMNTINSLAWYFQTVSQRCRCITFTNIFTAAFFYSYCFSWSPIFFPGAPGLGICNSTYSCKLLIMASTVHIHAICLSWPVLYIFMPSVYHGQHYINCFLFNQTISKLVIMCSG